jgi:hypothetical protein
LSIKRNCQRHQQQQDAVDSRDTAEMPTTIATAETPTTEERRCIDVSMIYTKEANDAGSNSL